MHQPNEVQLVLNTDLSLSELLHMCHTEREQNTVKAVRIGLLDSFGRILVSSARQ